MFRSSDKPIEVAYPQIGEPDHAPVWGDLDMDGAEFPRFLDNAEPIDSDSPKNWPLKRPFLDSARFGAVPSSVDFSLREGRRALGLALLDNTAPMAFVFLATATLILGALAAVLPRHETRRVEVAKAEGAAPVLQAVPALARRCRDADCNQLTTFASDAFRTTIDGVPSVTGSVVAAGPVDAAAPPRAGAGTDLAANPPEIAHDVAEFGGSSGSAAATVESPATFVIGMLPDGTLVPSATRLGPGGWALPADNGRPPDSPFDVFIPSDASAPFDTRIDLLQGSGASSGALRLRFHSGAAVPLTDRLSLIAAESLLVAARSRADLDQSELSPKRIGRRALSPAARRARLQYKLRAQEAAKLKASGASLEAGAPQAAGKVSQVSPPPALATAQTPPAAGPLTAFFNTLTQPATPSGLGAAPPPPPPSPPQQAQASQPWAPASITDAVTRPY